MTALKVVNGNTFGGRAEKGGLSQGQRPRLYLVGSDTDPRNFKILDHSERKAEVQAAQERADLIAALRVLAKKVLIVAAVLSCALICGLLIGYLLSPEVIAGGHYEVIPGDTLWEIAQKIKGTRSTADTVALIQELNNLSDSVLIVGQQLIIPAS